MIKQKQRPLLTIVDELRRELRHDTPSIVRRGELLAEAKKQVGHGNWLSWLKREFSLSVRTAANYTSAFQFAVKFATVANFDKVDLSPSALYLLAQEGEKGRGANIFTRKVIVAILKEAEQKRVDEDRAHTIAREIGLPPPPAKQTEDEIKAAQEAEDALHAEIEDALDGPAPELPPAPSGDAPSIRDESLITAFRIGNQMLEEVVTKPASMFKDIIAREDLLSHADFLRMVAGTPSAPAPTVTVDAALATLIGNGERLQLTNLLAANDPLDLIDLAKDLQDIAADLKRKRAAAAPSGDEREIRSTDP